MEPKDSDVVISGFAGRFPLSDNLDELAHNLWSGIDMVTEDESRYPKGYWDLPSRVAKVKSYDRFDAEFFNCNPADCYGIDPKMRLLLEVSYEAIADAGIDPDTLKGTNTGVFHGSCFQEPNVESINAPDTNIVEEHGQTTRISSHFDLKGPVCHIDTACASSFCSFHEAVMAVKTGYCDRAIVTGSNTCFQPFVSQQMLDLKMISPNGISRALDGEADGYVRSEAVVAAVIEKRCDAKRVYATVLNSKSNSDGYKPEGITYPGTVTQQELVRTTYEEIGLSPLDIQYVEAHATGTVAGDPIELNSMHSVLCEPEELKGRPPVLIGCVKSNLGHGEGASGMCALAKAILMMQRGSIPPNLHYKIPNPQIKGLMDKSFKPVTEVTPLPDNRLVALNSFGFGGSNIHTVIRGELEPELANSNWNITTSRMPRLVLICGRHSAAVEHIYQYIKSHKNTQTRGFLYLLNEWAKTDSSGGMKTRGFMLMEQNSERDLSFETARTIEPRNKPVYLYFADSANELSSSVSEFLDLPEFHASIQRSAYYLKGFGQSLDKIVKNPGRSPSERILMNCVIQLALVDVFKALEIKSTKGFLGTGYGEIACGYFSGILPQSQAILLALTASRNPVSDFGNLDRMLRSVLPYPERRPSEWISSGLPFASSEYFAEKLTEPSNGVKHLAEDAIVIQISSVSVFEKFAPNRMREAPAKQMLRTLGELYQNGNRMLIETLYPMVELPLPSTTASISPLIMWDHRHEFSLDKTSLLDICAHGKFTMMVKNIPYHFDARAAEDAFLLDHRIDSRILFPATGLLMIAYNAYARLLNKSVLEVPVEFSNVSFLRMTTISPDKELTFSARVNEDTGNFEIKESGQLVAVGTIKTVEVGSNDHKLVQDFPQDTSEHSNLNLPLKDIYKEFRVRGYDYEPYFQGISSALSDGRKGQVIWRDIMAKVVRENFPMPDQDAADLHWLRSWTSFVDAMSQFSLLTIQDGGRGMFVPTNLRSLICDPKILCENIRTNAGHSDTLILGESSHLEVQTNTSLDAIFTKGLVVRGLKTRLLRRSQDMARAHRFEFVPFKDQSFLPPKDTDQLQHYYQTCKELADTISNSNRMKPEQLLQYEEKFQLDSEENVLLRTLLTKVQARKSAEVKADLSRDRLLRGPEAPELYPARFTKAVYDLTIDQIFHNKDQRVEFLEVNDTNHSLSEQFKLFHEETVLYDRLAISYSVLALTKESSEVKDAGKIYSLDTVDQMKSVDCMVLKYFNEELDVDIIEKLIAKVGPGGFLFIFNQTQPLDSESLVNLIEQFDPKRKLRCRDPEQIKEMAQAMGFEQIFKRDLCKGLLPLNLLAFRRVAENYTKLQHRTFYIGFEDNHWTDELRSVLQKEAENPNCRIWLVPKADERASQSSVSGLLGFAKSLKLEPGGSKIRCLLNFRVHKELDFENDPEMVRLVKLDMTFNIYDEKIGSYGHYELFTYDGNETVRGLKHLYLKPVKPGDLTSLVWAQHDLDYRSETNLVNVYYAPLNFKDVLYATGKLPIDSASGISPAIAQDSLLGLEFAGVDNHGRRVMGSLPYKALATTVVIDDDTFFYPVPDHWTLEEASTIPVAYLTALYALDICGHYQPGESVLIHAGAGGVGQAAIRLCLARGLKVYTSCGSPEKRQFLLEEFRDQLLDEDIFSSRDCKFEEKILYKTNGRGVDLVLNSLADEMLQASLRCLAEGGRFLEIGKVDMIKDTRLWSYQYAGNRTFFGIFVDSFFGMTRGHFTYQRQQRDRPRLNQLIIEKLNDGTIQPLKRTVFDMSQAEDAFRFMATGKHIGKVVLKIRENRSLATELVHTDYNLSRTYFYPYKSYVVIGGLGGFGLEICYWMAERGARKLLISGRRGIREPYQQYSVDRLRKQFGVQVEITQQDIRTEEGISQLIKAAEKLGPVGGFFNAAAVYNDSLFADQTDQTWDLAISPKALTSFYFDRLSRLRCPEMDYFVCFSSLSCARGNEGQTNYNFGNSAMDRICELRRRDGLHGCSIQWGVIGDVGEVTERSGGNGMVLLGSTSQRMPSCFFHLDRFIRSNSPVFSCCVKANESGESVKDTMDVLKLLSRVLGMKNIQTIDPASTLASLGIDSLMAVEIQQIIERNKGVQMSLKAVRELSIKDFIEIAS